MDRVAGVYNMLTRNTYRSIMEILDFVAESLPECLYMIFGAIRYQ